MSHIVFSALCGFLNQGKWDCMGGQQEYVLSISRERSIRLNFGQLLVAVAIKWRAGFPPFSAAMILGAQSIPGSCYLYLVKSKCLKLVNVS